MFNQDNINPQNLTSSVSDIYDDLKPTLYKFARKYNIRNSQEFVEDFLSDTYFTLKKFDDKVLTLRVKDGGKVVDYNSTIHSNAQVYRSIRSYLTTTFINKYFKQYKRQRRTMEVDDIVTYADAIDFKTSHFWAMYNSDSMNVEISMLVDLITKDIERNDQSNNVENSQVAFMEALKAFCIRIIETYGDICIFKNILAEDSKLSADFLDVLYNGLCKELCSQIIVESNPAILPTLGLLINPDNKGALKKRIYRYLYTYKGGVALRLGKLSGKNN